jgi:tRNA(Glu) U13 pseudouridine synthase TruD
MQRFGASVPTHIVGRALLRGDWAAAVALILTPRSGHMSPAPAVFDCRANEQSDASDARAYFVRTRDIPGTLERMPVRVGHSRLLAQSLWWVWRQRFLFAERRVLDAMQQPGFNSFKAALLKARALACIRRPHTHTSSHARVSRFH